MDIYSHIVNKWERNYVGNTIDHTKILMENDFPYYKMHIIQINEEDPMIDIAYEDLKRHKLDRTFTTYMDYSQRFFNPPIKNGLHVIQYKGVIVDSKVF